MMDIKLVNQQQTPGMDSRHQIACMNSQQTSHLTGAKHHTPRNPKHMFTKTKKSK